MWRPITHSTAWNDALRRFDWPHVLQSWEWGEFKARWGWSAQRWALMGDDGLPCALVCAQRAGHDG
jgi:lipid II:glycine glycyltransferase (peptidoglycan interpeptide bridge formation enzyme)